MRDLLDRCRAGVIIGLGIAAVYSGFVLVVVLVTGGAGLERRGLSVLGVIATYLFGGVAGGVAFGFVAPLGSTRIRAAMVGAFIMVPIFAASAVLLPNASLSDPTTWLAIALCSLVIGGGGTYSAWEPDWIPRRGRG